MYKYIIAIITLLVFSTTSCKNEDKMDAEPTEVMPSGEREDIIRITKKQFESSGYELGKPMRTSFDKIIPVSGSIHVPEKNRAKVGTYIDGTVGSINLIEGQWVNKGQTLFTITNPELINIQEGYLLASEELLYKMSERERLEQLLAEKLTTKNELTKVNFEINNLKTRIASLKTRIQLVGMNADDLSNDNLSSTVSILAPMGGYVSNISAMKGQYLETSQSAMDITNTAHKHLELHVLERDINRISNGQKIEFYLQDESMKIYAAEVYMINKMVDDDHMIKVHCHIEKENAKTLIPGMYATAKIVTQSVDLTALPKDAIVEMEGKSFALLLKSSNNDEYLFEKVQLEAGEKNENYVEIKSIDNLEDQYLTKGAYFIIM